jgi:hypothetical protein
MLTIIRAIRAFRSHLDVRTLVGALLVVLLLRVGLGLLALPISAAFPHTPLEKDVRVVPGNAPMSDWLQRVVVMPWVRYDAWNYQRIVDHGYRLEEGTAAFHPLYPLVTVPVALLLGGNIFLALLVVSTLACIALSVLFARYVKQVHGDSLAAPATWLLLLAPPAFIVLVPYNEGLFMVLAVACLLALHSERWWWAGVLGGLAALTRQQGVALVLPLAWAVVVALRQERARWWHMAAVALVPGGYALFVLYRAVALGDLEALAHTEGVADFLRTLLVSRSSEQVLTGQRITWPWELLIDQIHRIATTPQSYDLVIDMVLGWAGVLVIVAGWRILHPYERLYSLAIIGLSLCYYNGVRSPYLSLPRHIYIAFPLFIVLAAWAAKGGGHRLRWMGYALALGNIFLAGAFVRHGWVP